MLDFFSQSSISLSVSIAFLCINNSMSVVMVSCVSVDCQINTLYNKYSIIYSLKIYKEQNDMSVNKMFIVFVSHTLQGHCFHIQ